MSAHLYDVWSFIQQTNPELCSPYYRPEFAQAVAAARADTYVAVVDDGAAFLPFQRQNFGIGCPVGGLLSDYHGLIAPPAHMFRPEEIVRKAGLQVWDFDHVPAGQTAFKPWTSGMSESWIIDLTQPGATGSAQLREEVRRKRRKLAREIGPLEFEFKCTERSMRDQCWTWKSAQYQRTGVRDVLVMPWVQATLVGVAEQNGPKFSGLLSVLRAGGRPVAAHFGMRSGELLHYWFPSYDVELSNYSPGSLLLLAIVDAAAEHGVTRIDLGRGDALYKRRVANSVVPLLEGCVVGASSVVPLMRRGRRTLKNLLKKVLPPHTRVRTMVY
jgi:CelD/BcsL family acetyltransferase involved in cellulose biosynthesis